MWYVESGNLKGVSGKETLEEAFLDLFDSALATSEVPTLGLLAAGSKVSFDYENDPETLFFVPVLMLQKAGRMSKDGTIETPDSVLSEEYIDAPNSREDFWPDVIDD